jgi:putative PIN family toxin of toxin-antitoxin system
VRVVLDVNILVRANEKSHGPARTLLLDLIARGHIVLTSVDILIELARVLRYPRVQALFGLSDEQIYDYVQFLKDGCEIVPTNSNWNFPIRDVSDTPILRTATAAKPISSARSIQTSTQPKLLPSAARWVSPFSTISP